MRIDRLLQSKFALTALVLSSALCAAACHEADGTEEVPGVYPPEKDIDRPKGGAKDAGRPSDAGSTDGGAAGDGGSSEDASASDAGAASDGSAG